MKHPLNGNVESMTWSAQYSNIARKNFGPIAAGQPTHRQANQQAVKLRILTAGRGNRRAAPLIAALHINPVII